MEGDRTNIKDNRKCQKIWAARNPQGIWFVYGQWGRGSSSVTRTLGYRKSKVAADNLARVMRRLYY